MEQTQINVNTETDLVEVFVQRNKSNKYNRPRKDILYLWIIKFV